ncbi:MAG: 1-acyl-sn-glycerol-3-phosphate acyltransferase, partial [Actinobacteria bacterium]|nr:1-acyl-sn-glycerol-3-phosphate acyltransferase [Actinomycetota bacterium]
MWWRYIILRPPFALLAKTKKYKLKVDGGEHVLRSGPFIVVANHQSSTDIVAIALALKTALVRSHMWPWAKVEIERGREGPLGKTLWKVFGVIPIDRDAGQSEEAIRSSLEYLQRGEIICVFPEGTRYKNKELGWFEYGVANLARAAPAPVLPVGIYRREDGGGIQVNIGRPFFMPPKKTRHERLEALEDR